MYVELNHINKRFGNYQASDDVNFGIEKGKLIAYGDIDPISEQYSKMIGG